MPLIPNRSKLKQKFDWRNSTVASYISESTLSGGEGERGRGGALDLQVRKNLAKYEGFLGKRSS